MRWKYRLTNRRLSLMPSSARPNRVELPRSRASWPSAESKMSETMKSTNPITFVQRSWYANRWPATSPITSDHSVTWSAEIPVGCSARAIRMPMGRKKWRSTHSSTARPLCDKSLCGFTEHFLHDGEGAHRLVLLDHQRRIDADLRIVDHREHAARQQRVEDPPGGLLVEQGTRSGDDEIHPDQEAPAAHIGDDGQLRLPALHFGEHRLAQPPGVLHQALLDDRLHRDACRGRRERVAAIARRAAARVGPGLGERDLLTGDHAAQREAAAEALPHRENVRQHALVLDREHPPRAPEAGDHLVADEERAQFVGQLAQLLQVAGGRDHVAGGALDRLYQDRGDVLRGLDLDLLPQELDAMPLARRERLVERAARAPGVGRKVSAGHQRPERMLEARAEHRQHAAGLAVEAAPEADHLGVPGAGLGEPQGTPR